MQASLIAGDSLEIIKRYIDFPASAGWALKLRLVPVAAALVPIELAADASEDTFKIIAGSGTTSGWAPGLYNWSLQVSKDDYRQTLDQGQLTIRPDPATLTAGSDTRGHLEKVIAAIEAMIENRASRTEQEYTIADRAIKHIPIPELLVWRDRYKFQLAQEKAGASGKPIGRGRKIYTRF